MKEITDIIKAYNEAVKAGRQSALATVVSVEGSSYRRPGARMLVTDDGMLTGAISGGCLEGDALRKALLVMQQQKPMLATYDTTDEDDAKLGVQLGCNGIVHILIEPINTADENNPVELLKIVTGKRRSAVIATLFSLQDRKAAQPGTCLLLTEDGVIKSACLQPELKEKLLRDMQAALQENRSAIKEYCSHTILTGFIELISPPVALILFGAGNDALPVMQMAAVLGWQLTVVDGRSNYATQQRFPLAQQVIIAKADTALAHVSFDTKTAVVLMTHNYNYDIALLQQLLPLQLPYTGVLGPRKKLDRMLHELEEKGMEITPQQLQSVYGPMGLDVGAETSEEIALSVLAEIKAVMAGSNGSPLRSKLHTIHSHI
ncbi:XdhC family protein [Ilyomonas limi]|uniref:XdhC family protein n=1 Tax=Ilyomonas limi TaxID=2575867 RepID=A0A4U3LB19_9BACT|nr:XdhC/CoxI family protein [Ilyomonas limi]TKK71664.1 XdhC family protein [Ilyomonas limi]